MKLTSIILAGATGVYALESAGDFHDDSYAWQWNYKNRVEKIISQVINQGHIGNVNDNTEFISSYKLNKYVNDLADYMDFKLKFPIQEFFDYCAGEPNAYMMSFDAYTRCKMELQRKMKIYPKIFPLITEEQLKQLRTYKVRSGYQSKLTKDDFKKLETLSLIINGAAVFQISDGNSDGRVDIFEGYEKAEGYEMLSELTRLYDRTFDQIKTIIASCTGSGDVIKIILTVAKLEWHLIGDIVKSNGGLQAYEATTDYYSRKRSTTTTSTTTTTTTTTTPYRRPSYNYNNRYNNNQRQNNYYNNRYNNNSPSYANHNQNRYNSNSRYNYNSQSRYNNYNSNSRYNNNNNQYGTRQNNQYGTYRNNGYKSATEDKLLEKKSVSCGDFRAKNISPEEKKNRLLCWFNNKRHA